MAFDVTADAYGRFMGRYSEPLARELVDLVDVRAGQRALDVGCGPGALTAALVDRLGVAAVSAVDPSAPFVEAVRARFPGLDVQRATAERLPFADAAFDRTLAQLVVHFMADPAAGLAEMARVTRAGGLVAANVWDHAGGTGPLSLFWRAVREVDPDASSEAGLAGAASGQLVELFEAAGLTHVRPATQTVRVPYATFDDWWEPYTFGVGPAGAYLAGVDEARREAVRRRCVDLLPEGPFEITATAWCALGRVRD